MVFPNLCLHKRTPGGACSLPHPCSLPSWTGDENWKHKNQRSQLEIRTVYCKQQWNKQTNNSNYTINNRGNLLPKFSFPHAQPPLPCPQKITRGCVKYPLCLSMSLLATAKINPIVARTMALLTLYSILLNSCPNPIPSGYIYVYIWTQA